MKGKAIIPLVLGLCVGLVAVKFGVDAIKRARGSAPAQQTIEAVRAKLDINAYEAITAEMVELVKTTDEMFVPGQQRIATVEEVVGRVSAKAIPAQSPVLLSMLAPEGTPPGMVGRIPPGFRAVSVRIDEVTGVAYQVRPGDYVDVIVVMDVVQSGTRNKRETIAEVILQGIQVAAIGQDSSGPTRDATGAKSKPARSATLMVAEADVPKLHLAATRGKITLAMRGDSDTVTDAIGFVRDSDVFAALREDPEPVETTPAPKMPAIPQLAQLLRQPKPEPEPEPCDVLVCRGSTVATVRPTAERIYFESPDSTEIIGTSEGLVAPKAGELSQKRSKRSRLPDKQEYDVPERDDRQPDDDQQPDDGE